MSYLVRKIAQVKWQSDSVLSGNPVPADAITSCLRTTGNKLSTWEIDDVSKVQAAVLAIASNLERLDTIDIACIKKSDVESTGIICEDSPGDTPIADLANTHVDLCGMTYDLLGELSRLIIQSFQDQTVQRFTKSKLKKLLLEAIDKGEASVEIFKKTMQTEIMK